jgi:hypothetical protein
MDAYKRKEVVWLSVIGGLRSFTVNQLRIVLELPVSAGVEDKMVTECRRYQFRKIRPVP